MCFIKNVSRHLIVEDMASQEFSFAVRRLEQKRLFARPKKRNEDPIFEQSKAAIHAEALLPREII
jgi:hypothetical protein